MARMGIYQVLCKNTGHRYIGSAENIDEQWTTHQQELRKGKHQNKAFQYAWSLFGETSFELSVLEETSAKLLAEKEQHYLQALKPELNVLETVGRRSPGREKKITTTVRLDEKTVERLKKYCYVFRKSQTELIECALLEHFERLGLMERYQVNVTKDHVVLVRIEGEKTTVLEIGQRNGISPEKIVEEFSTKLKTQVSLVMQQP
jgi:group I intron endonuclease